MRNKMSNILWGLGFIVVGLGFAGNAFGLWDFRLFFRGWWTLFIIIPSLISMIQNGPRTTSVIGLCVGGLLLLSAQNVINGQILGDLIVPIILVIIGLGFIFKTGIRREKISENMKAHYHSDGAPDLTAIFGGRDANFRGEIFTGADINAIFGGVELDLRGSIINENVVIRATVIFGGIDIYVPSNVKVKVSSMPIFGGVSDKSLAPADPDAPILYVNATCMFGGIDIK